jgi:chromosome segregation ATPase
MRCFALLALGAATLLQLKQDAAFLDQDSKEYPVTKVVKLLKDMQATLQKEMETDQEVYDKLACWCETNDKEKTAAVEVAEQRITSFVSEIEELSAKSSRLDTEIKTLNEEIAQNQEALNKATAIREKELEEFNAEEKDMMQSIQALKNAITVLGKHHEMPAESLVSIATLIRHHLHSKAQLLKGTISPDQKRTLTAFVQQPAGFQSYAPQSGAIFGILKQMKETFETNLSQAQKDELAAQDAFNELKTAKLAELAASKKAVDMKSVELAETDEKCAQAKENLSDTRDALSADQKFLLDLKEKCRMSDAEMEERTKARQAEIAAVGEAIAILTSDESRDTFSSTLGFVQVNAVLNKSKRARREAVAMLKAAAKKTGSTQLLALAASAGLDAFTKVIAAIDEMIVDLKQQLADDVEHKDYCTKELAENEKATMIAQDEKSDLEAHIEDLKSTIDTLTKDIKTKEAEVAEMQVQIKRASEDREMENKEFQQTVADQRATQAILTKALDRLKEVYGFVQTKAKAKQEPGADAPPPPPGFSTYKKNEGAGGVLSMMEGIITDAKIMETEAIKAEQDSQSAYESFVKNTNDSIASAQKAIINMSEDKAKAEESLTQAEQDYKATMAELEQLASYAADLHKSCDFTLKNFDIRQEAMAQEIEALGQAKAVLSGADFS